MTIQKPERKEVAGGGIGGALAAIVVWIVSLLGAVVPPEVAAALGSVLGAVVAWLTPRRPAS